jgi:hypothetical protein
MDNLPYYNNSDILPIIYCSEHKIKSYWEICKWKQPHMKTIPQIKHNLSLLKYLGRVSAQYEVGKSSFLPLVLYPPIQFNTVQQNTWNQAQNCSLKVTPYDQKADFLPAKNVTNSVPQINITNELSITFLIATYFTMK